MKLVASWHQTLLAMLIKSWHFGNVKSWYNKKLQLNASLSSRHVSPSRWDSPWCSGFGGEGKGGTKGIKQTASRNKWNRRNNWATAPSWPHNLSYLNRECVMTCILLIPQLEESGICVCVVSGERGLMLPLDLAADMLLFHHQKYQEPQELLHKHMYSSFVRNTVKQGRTRSKQVWHW